MTLRLLYFAVLREQAGAGSESVKAPDGSTAASVFESRFPGLALRVGFAKNGTLCSPDTPLHDGDELACLPPVGGG